MTMGHSTSVRFQRALDDLRIAQKSSAGAAAYSRFVNRPLGRPLAALAAALGMSPTQVTIVSAATTFTGIVCISALPPSLWSALAVAVLLVLGYALDSADGQLARLNGTSSISGEWLDHLVDATKTPAVHIAVLICWFRFFDFSPVWLLVPLLYSIVATIMFFGFISTDLLRRLHATGNPPVPVSGWRSSPLYSLAVLPADYGILCLSFVTLAWPGAHRIVYTALAVCTALLLIPAVVRWFRAMDRVEVPVA